MTKNKNQIGIVLEYFWLIVFVLTGIQGFIDTFKRGIDDSYMFFIMCILALLLYLARRNLRLKNKHNSPN